MERSGFCWGIDNLVLHCINSCDKNQKANHIVSAVDEKGFCLGQKRVEKNK